MWEKVGIFRTGNELQEAITIIEKLKKEDIPQLSITNQHTRYNQEFIEALEVENMVLVAEMIARAALMREESRGAHYRKDYPKSDNKNWLSNIIIDQKHDQIRLTKQPVVLTKLKPEA